MGGMDEGREGMDADRETRQRRGGGRRGEGRKESAAARGKTRWEGRVRQGQLEAALLCGILMSFRALEQPDPAQPSPLVRCETGATPVRKRDDMRPPVWKRRGMRHDATILPTRMPWRFHVEGGVGNEA